MNPSAMVETALMLGALVIAAGLYGLLYCVARLRESSSLNAASGVTGAVMCAVALAIVVVTPLHPGWKVLVAASAVVYVAIPPVTWRYLARVHSEGSESHDSESAQHADRIGPRLHRSAG